MRAESNAPSHTLSPPLISLWQLFLVFLRLGSVGFGGPIALISLMEEEFVTRRRWVSRDAFNETYVFCKMMPGPVAFQVALWVGYYLRGRIGGLVVGLGFLIPGVLLILLLTIFYTQLAHLSSFHIALQGMRLGALVVIGDSLWRMFQPYRKELPAWAYALISGALMLLFPRWEPVLIFLGGLISVFGGRASHHTLKSLPPVSLLASLFWVHFKAGAFVFGTGLAILPVLEAEVVNHYHWLTRPEFMDGIAFGQVTPGPVTITSVFIGYKAAGFSGAMVSLLGMYLPATLLILFLFPLFRKRVEKTVWLFRFQKGAIWTVIGCIAGATILLGKASVTHPRDYILLGLMLLALWKTKLPGWIFIPIGALGMFFLQWVIPS